MRMTRKLFFGVEKFQAIQQITAVSWSIFHLERNNDHIIVLTTRVQDIAREVSSEVYSLEKISVEEIISTKGEGGNNIPRSRRCGNDVGSNI